jgi:hypothetical protein
VNQDLVLPLISSLGWLILCGAALASYQLKWNQMIKMALVWVAIFLGLFLIVEWFMFVRSSAGVAV